jgi:nicotinamidase-related amidase
MISVPALPYPFSFRRSHTALLVIDMQNDFCANGGFAEKLGNDVTPTRSIIPVIQRILSHSRENGLLIIHTREGHLPDLSDCPPSKLRRSRSQGAGIGDVGPMGRILVRGEYGHDFVAELRPIAGEYIIDKPGKGAFYATELDEWLRQHQIESVIVTGVTTHVCVHTTVREANDRGFECLVIEDATATFDPADQEAAIRMFHQQGAIFGWVTTTDKFISALSP